MEMLRTQNVKLTKQINDLREEKKVWIFNEKIRNEKER